MQRDELLLPVHYLSRTNPVNNGVAAPNPAKDQCIVFFRIIDFVSSKNASQKGQWQEFWSNPERQSTRGRFLSY